MNQATVPHPALLGAACALSCDLVSAEVIAALRDAGVPAILLKGPSIARWLYPSGGRRYTDTDILVPGARVGRAEAVLGSLGFTTLLGSFHPAERCALPDGFHPAGGAHPAETTYVRRAAAGQGREGLVDLHHNLPMVPASDQALWRALSADTETLRLGGVEARVLGRTALALHVVLHAVQHGFRGHVREDLSRAIAAMSPEDWRGAADLAVRLGVADILGSGLRHQPAGAGIADHLGLPGGPLADSRLWSRLAPRGAASLAELPALTLRQKAERIRWTLLPSRAKIRYVSRRPDARGRPLLLGYARWWYGLTLALVPAVRHLSARRRLANSGGPRRPPSPQLPPHR